MLGARHAPGAVLSQLREIDPRADLVYIEGGEWLLGLRKVHNSARDTMLRAALGRELVLPISRQRDRRLALLRLYLEGFYPSVPRDESLVGTVTLTDDSAEPPLAYKTEELGLIVRDFRMKVWTLVNRAAENLEEIIRREELDELVSANHMRDLVDSDFKSDHGIIHRGRVSIVNPADPTTWN